MTPISGRFPSPLSIILSLICLFGLNSVSANPSTGVEPYIAAADTAELQSALREKGWDTRLDSSGSLFVYYGTRQKTSALESISSNFDRFAEALGERGWSARRDTDGNLILRPQQRLVELPDKTRIGLGVVEKPAAASPSRADLNMARLSEQLESAGWETHTDQHGNLILQLTNTRPAIATVSGNKPVTAPVHTLTESLALNLRGTGWTTGRDESGALTLSRSAATTSPSATNEITAIEEGSSGLHYGHQAPGDGRMQPGRHRLYDFRIMAERMGWKAAQDIDDNLLVFPVSQS